MKVGQIVGIYFDISLILKEEKKGFFYNLKKG